MRRAGTLTIVTLATVGGAVLAAAAVWVWEGVKASFPWEAPRVLR